MEPETVSILEGLVPESERTAVAATEARAGTTAKKPETATGTGRKQPEAPWGELAPLIALAAISCLFGLVGLSRSWFSSWLGDADGDIYRTQLAEGGHLIQPDRAFQLAPNLFSTLLALLVLLLGLGIVYLAARRKPAYDPVRIMGPFRKPAFEGFYADRAQQALVVRPIEKLAQLVGFLDREVVDGYVRGAGFGAKSLGGGLRRLQNGNVQLYLTGVLTGVVIIAAVLGFGR
jgi:NADH-quinone oxidoreductase subunit L